MLTKARANYTFFDISRLLSFEIENIVHSSSLAFDNMIIPLKKPTTRSSLTEALFLT